MKNKKKFIVVTGGAGFVGSNLIEYLLNKTNYKIISIDNYSSGRCRACPKQATLPCPKIPEELKDDEWDD